MKRCLFAIALTLLGAHAFTQSPADKATAVRDAQRAMLMISFGNAGDAIILLKNCMKLDPDAIVYPLEIAFAHYRATEYKRAVDILVNLRYHKDVNARVYHLLVKCQLLQGEEKRAVKTLDEGIRKFPAAGNLYMEGGLYRVSKKDTANAILLFDKGIAKDPGFPPNYYHAARMRLQRPYGDAWKLYAEIFCNMEPNSYRCREMSRRLFYAERGYQQYFNTMDSAVQQQLTTIKNSRNLSVLDTLCQDLLLRKNDIQINYNNMNTNLLLLLAEYREKLAKAGHEEAYLYWLYKFADNTGFINWKDVNVEKWDAFANWFNTNSVGYKFWPAQDKEPAID